MHVADEAVLFCDFCLFALIKRNEMSGELTGLPLLRLCFFLSFLLFQETKMNT